MGTSAPDGFGVIVRVGGYTRVSTADQATDGHSLGYQKDAIQRFCKVREGWQVVEWYCDAGISGSSGNRPELQRLVRDAEDGRLDVVICHAVDRFYRNLRGLLTTLDRLNKVEVGFVSIRENMDFTTPWGKLMLAVLGSLAEIYLDNLSKELSKGKIARARKGLSNFSVAPFGYLHIDGKSVLEETTASGVILAYEAYATGQYADQGIAKLLASKGYPTPRAAGKHWTKSAARHILMNRFYLGEVTHNGEWYPGQHEPLISQDLWGQCQEVRREKGEGKIGYRNTGRVYLLQRVAHCWDCGYPLHMAMQHGMSYYRDPAGYRGIDCRVKGREVQQGRIDAQVAEIVKRLELPEDWRERLQELIEHKEERDKVEGQRRYLVEKLRRLRDLYVEGDYSRVEYDSRRADLQAQLDALQEPDRPNVEQAGEVLESLGAEWAQAPKRIQRDMLRVIFRAIYVDIAARHVVCIKPYPQFLPLFRMDGLSEKDGCFYVDEEESETGSQD